MDTRWRQLQQLLAEDPTDAFLQHALGLEYMKQNELEKAAQVFQTLLQQTPNYLASYYQLGKVLVLLGKEEEAISCYEKGMAIAKEQQNQRTYNELKNALEEQEYL